jgi:hypothetical protein
MCIGIDIFILVFSTLISQVLFGININVIEYTFLPYLDFNIFNDVDALNVMNKELGINLNMKSGVIIDLVSIIIFYYFGRLFFINKDVKN